MSTSIVGHFYNETYAAVCHYVPNIERLEIIKLQKNLLQLRELKIITRNDAASSATFQNHMAKSKRRISMFDDVLRACNYVLKINAIAAAVNGGAIDNKVSILASRDHKSMIRARILSKSEVSLNLKHREALARFLLSKKQYILVLEDDAIPDEYTLTNLFAIYRHLKQYSLRTPFYVDLGGGCNLKYDKGYTRSYVHLNQNICLAEPMWPSSRTTCAYFANKAMAIKILLSSITPYAPIDFEFLACMQDMANVRESFKCLWADPPCFEHGSQVGVVKRSIRST